MPRCRATCRAYKNNFSIDADFVTINSLKIIQLLSRIYTEMPHTVFYLDAHVHGLSKAVYGVSVGLDVANTQSCHLKKQRVRETDSSVLHNTQNNNKWETNVRKQWGTKRFCRAGGAGWMDKNNPLINDPKMRGSRWKTQTKTAINELGHRSIATTHILDGSVETPHHHLNTVRHLLGVFLEVQQNCRINRWDVCWSPCQPSASVDWARTVSCVYNVVKLDNYIQHQCYSNYLK